MTFPRMLNSRFADLMRSDAFQKKVIEEVESPEQFDDDDEILTNAFDVLYDQWMQDFESRGDYQRGQVTLYRGISADHIDDIDLGNAGVHWTWDKDKAANYSDTNTEKNMYILKAKAPISEINLEDTLRKIVWNGYSHEESEREIELNKGAKLELLDIIDPENESVDLTTDTITAALHRILARDDLEVSREDDEVKITIPDIGSITGQCAYIEDEEDAMEGFPLGLLSYGEEEAQRIFQEIEDISRIFYIEDLSVDPSYRQKGYAKELLKALEKEVGTSVDAIMANASPNGTDRVPFSALKHLYTSSGYEFLTIYEDKNGLILKRV